MAQQQRTFCSTSEKVIHVMYSQTHTLSQCIYTRPLHGITSARTLQQKLILDYDSKNCVYLPRPFMQRIRISLSLVALLLPHIRVAARQHSKRNTLSQSKSTHNCNLCRNLLGNLFAIWYGFAIKKKERRKKPVIPCQSLRYALELVLVTRSHLKSHFECADLHLIFFYQFSYRSSELCTFNVEHLSPKYYILLIAVY